MTEVTRVPLQPIAKGSLVKLWLGVIIAVLIGAGVAWAAVPKGVSVDELVAGTGDSPQLGDVAFIKYVGTLDDGTEFDKSEGSPFPPGVFPDGTPMLLEEGQLIDGFLQGIQKMEKGGKYRLFIPSDLAYGDEVQPGSPIPAGADLTFEVELVDFMSREDAEAKMMALQQAMEAQQGAPGSEGPAGPPAGPQSAAPTPPQN